MNVEQDEIRVLTTYFWSLQIVVVSVLLTALKMWESSDFGTGA